MMQIEVLLFGQLTDITGKSKLVLEKIPDTGTLIRVLHEMYPALESSKYVLAVDRKVTTENTLLSGGNTVALLPPFSGG